MQEELLIALLALIESAEGADLRALVGHYGHGLAPKTKSAKSLYPVLVWHVPDFSDEEYTMTPGADYYETLQVQFNVGSLSESGLEAIRIGKELSDLLRNNPLTLSTGRNIDVNLLAGRDFENPEGDGWEYVRLVEYQIGT